MPVRYENFLVDPWKGAKEAEVMNLRRGMMRQDDEQFKARNELARRGLEQGQMNADRDFSLRRKASEQLGKQYESNQAKTEFDLFAKRASLIYEIGLGVKDNQTYQDARSVIKQFVENGMAPKDWYEQMPESYDPQKHKAAMNALKPFAHTKVAGTPQKVDAGDRVILLYPDGTREEIKKGQAPSTPKDSTKTNVAARRGLADVYKTLTKELDWKPGQEIPAEYLEQINGYRKEMDEPPLTAKEVRTKKWWGLAEDVSTAYVPEGDGAGTTPAAPPSGGETPAGSLDDLLKRGRSMLQTPPPSEVKPVSDTVAAPIQPTQPSVEPIGELDNGLQFGRSDRGYVVIEDGVPRQPTEDELQAIQIQIRRSPRMGGKAIPMPKYIGPQGGYLQGGRSTTPPNVSGRR